MAGEGYQDLLSGDEVERCPFQVKQMSRMEEIAKCFRDCRVVLKGPEKNLNKKYLTFKKCIWYNAKLLKIIL